MQASDGLLPGEKLLWKGSPEPGIRLRPRDAFLFLFGLFFFGFSIVWEYIAFTNGSPGFFLIWGIPFIAVGTYLVIGRFFWEAYKRKRTAYTLTDRRALIQVNTVGRSQKAVALKEVAEIELEERGDGMGTIVFGRDITVGSGDATNTYAAPRFEFIKDAKRIYDMIETARNKAISS